MGSSITQKEIDFAVLEAVFPEFIREKDFMQWFREAYKRIYPVRESNEKLAFNISEITFSIHQYPNGMVGKKIAIGVLADNLDVSVKGLFWSLVNKYCPKGKNILKEFIQGNDIYLVGIGLEMEGANEKVWKFYIMLPNGKMLGINCRNGEVVEKKIYTHSEEGWLVPVKGKHGRIQLNIETSGKNAFKAIKLFHKKGYISKKAKDLAERIVLLGLSLDTISSSKTRGFALYFE